MLEEIIKVPDSMREKYPSEQVSQIILGVLTVKWLSDNRAGYSWNISPHYYWENIRNQSEGVKKFLLLAAEGLEEENSILAGIFSDYLFASLKSFADADIWMIINNIDRLEFKNNKEASKYIQRYINQCNSWGKIMTESRFTSPEIISRLLVELVDVTTRQDLCDICSGLGGTMVEAVKLNPLLKVYGQEINSKAFYISKLNLLMHGHHNFIIKQGDIIARPELIQDNMLLKHDAVVGDLPFIAANWGYQSAAADRYGRFIYGTAPSMSSEWAFIQHALAVTKDSGKAAVVTTRGSLSKLADEKIRANILKDDLIEAVIDLPEKLYEGSSVPVSIIIFNKSKPMERRKKILMIDASQEYIVKNRRTNTLSEKQKEKLLLVFRNGEEIDNYSTFVELPEISENGYRLNPINYLQINAIAADMKNPEKLRDLTGNIFRGVQISAKEIDELQKSPEANYYLLNVGDIHNGEIDTGAMVKIALKDPRWASLYLLEPGDLVISARSSNIKTAVIDKEMLIIAGNLICIRVNRDKINPYYLKIFLDSPVGQILIKGVQTGSVTKVLNPKNIGEIPVPVIGIERQNELANTFIDAQQRYLCAEKDFKSTLSALYEKFATA